jgi:hypothetical protein
MRCQQTSNGNVVTIGIVRMEVVQCRAGGRVLLEQKHGQAGLGALSRDAGADQEEGRREASGAKRQPSTDRCAIRSSGSDLSRTLVLDEPLMVVSSPSLLSERTRHSSFVRVQLATIIRLSAG